MNWYPREYYRQRYMA